jgi:large subunit ribosomal protein L32
MCIPQCRRSRTEVRRRRASFWYLDPLSIGECSRCHEPKLPHRVCKNCGFYNGRDILKMEQTEAEAE